MFWTTDESEFEYFCGQEFSLLHVVHTGCGVHPTSCPVGTGGTHPASVEAKKMWIYRSTPPYVFMA
jgi:hypothetical protein